MKCPCLNIALRLWCTYIKRLKNTEGILCMHHSVKTYCLQQMFYSSGWCPNISFQTLKECHINTMNKPKNLWVFIHTWCLICRHRCRSEISRINGGFRGAGLQVAGWRRVEVCKRRDKDGPWHSSSTTSASIDERLEHELHTNRRNDEEERRHERLRYRRKSFFFFFHFTSNKH